MDDTPALLCPHCGYDLRMLAGHTCPQCGGSVGEPAMGCFMLPWPRRREIGRLRALGQTFWVITRRPRSVCQAVAQPLDLQDALRFRLTVVWLVWLSLLVSLLAQAAFNMDAAASLFNVSDGLVLPIARLLVIVAAWPLLYAISGVQTYWFHPRHLTIEQQNRAVVLSYYACAPLLWLVPGLPLLMLGLSYLSWRITGRTPALDFTGIALAIGGIVLIAVAFGEFWGVSLLMARRAARRGSLGLSAMAVAMPGCWLVLTILCLLGPPLMGAMTWAMIETL